MLRSMHAATQPSVVDSASSWRVSRDGAHVAVVAVHHEGGKVVVATELGEDADSPGIDSCRFASLQAAEAFIADLMASFTYLGCDVVRG
jgi:hypothetical protein